MTRLRKRTQQSVWPRRRIVAELQSLAEPCRALTRSKKRPTAKLEVKELQELSWRSGKGESLLLERRPGEPKESLQSLAALKEIPKAHAFDEEESGEFPSLSREFSLRLGVLLELQRQRLPAPIGSQRDS